MNLEPDEYSIDIAGQKFALGPYSLDMPEPRYFRKDRTDGVWEWQQIEKWMYDALLQVMDEYPSDLTFTKVAKVA